ncbi:MAG: succinate dehydrogenase, hydrophobic membrane anchor protein [Gammaproteobacteria bacterium]|nr:succinate dehydrogenase, hydrophobic membrane anchor protein [Gammaproteobacteria bacterium]
MSGFSSPISRARNHGAAANGTREFLWERLTALALIPLGVVLFVELLGLTAGGVSLAEARAWLGAPVSGTLLILFFNLAMLNAYLCSRVLIEDYMHAPGLKLLVLTSLTGALVLLDVVVTMSVLQVMF